MRRIRSGGLFLLWMIEPVSVQCVQPLLQGRGKNNPHATSVHLSIHHSTIDVSMTSAMPLDQPASSLPENSYCALQATHDAIGIPVYKVRETGSIMIKPLPRPIVKYQTGSKAETCPGQEKRKTFGIEHALNGQPFGELDRVPAAGWSVTLQSFQWMHRAAGPDQQNDRLQMSTKPKGSYSVRP